MLTYNGVTSPHLCSNYLRNYYYSALLTYQSNYYFLPRSIGFLPISWWAHRVSGESDAHDSCLPQAGSRGLSPYYVCSFTYWSSANCIYTSVYTRHPPAPRVMYYYYWRGFYTAAG